MLNTIKAIPSIQNILKHLQSSSSLIFEGIWDCPKAILSLLIQQTGKHVLILTGSESDTRLYDDLLFFSNKNPILSFPAWETLPSEGITPNPDIVGKRLDILHILSHSSEKHILFSPLQGVLQKVYPSEQLKRSSMDITVKDSIPFDMIPELLIDMGYTPVALTTDKGQFSIRGGLVDIFPLSSLNPYRIDCFGDDIESIRSFDPVSQRSIEKTSSIHICPANELEFINRTTSTTILDYLGPNTVIMFEDLLSIENRYVALKKLSFAASPHTISLQHFLKCSSSLKKIFCTSQELSDLSDVKTVDNKTITFECFNTSFKATQVPHSFETIHTHYWEGTPLSARLETLMNKNSQHPIHFITSSEAEENALKDKISHSLLSLPSAEHFSRGYLSSGCVILDAPITLFPYTELTRKYKVSRQKWRNSFHTPAAEFHSLERGDLVVHLNNGIGKFLGIESQKNHKGLKEDFLLIEYAGHSKLYVPLSQSHLISRYIGTKEESPQLHTLGTRKWQQAKANAQKAIIGYAKDLIDMQAQREIKGGVVYPKDSQDFILFEEEFPFTETHDQLKAIAAIKKDMSSSKAMDRLICGDVGYGKTEVAMRAAFKAAYDGKKQVAVLVPTTVLAMQHYENFKTRMADFPVTIGVACRFIKPKAIKQTLEGVRKGSIDILIGTHRIISSDVMFHDLGLLILDEEQRFGVRAKEHLKKAKLGVDCLTLSATPIPRTLYFSMIGARDMSVINTPPQDRLPIKTILAEKNSNIIKNAILLELARDGQVYFIHNRVETIDQVAKDLQTLIPEARIGVAHGQMPANTLDHIFQQFKDGDIDLLVATTIVENGIDIPNANTILINRADALGMADLYQLRGRVGRWNRPAYAYFLIPSNRELQEISQKRLQALVETSGFGGGMKLAMRDLEIRGAGDLLGTQQSGNVSAIGFHFYCKLLKQAIDTLKKDTLHPFTETVLEHNYPATLPPSYIKEPHIRMELFHRLGEITTEGDLKALFEEITDRFGEIPNEGQWLYHINRIRLFGFLHHFTVIKFKKLALYAQRRKRNTLIEKNIFFPLIKDPDELEYLTKGFLTRDFCLSASTETLSRH